MSARQRQRHAAQNRMELGFHTSLQNRLNCNQRKICLKNQLLSQLLLSQCHMGLFTNELWYHCQEWQDLSSPHSLLDGRKERMKKEGERKKLSTFLRSFLRSMHLNRGGHITHFGGETMHARCVLENHGRNFSARAQDGPQEVERN